MREMIFGRVRWWKLMTGVRGSPHHEPSIPRPSLDVPTAAIVSDPARLSVAARARQVAFWSAACDPGRDESSLSARLSALTGPRSGLVAGAPRQEFLAKCVGLVAGARVPAGGGRSRRAEDAERTQDGAAARATPATPGTPGSADRGNHHTHVTMVQERLLEALLLSPPPPVAAPITGENGHERSGPAPMDVDAGGQGGDSEQACGAAAAAATGDEAMAAPEEPDGSTGGGSGAVPTALQVLASMVDSALTRTSTGAPGASVRGHDDGGGGITGGGAVSVLSRVLLSIDKTLLSASSLAIGPSDDPDLEYLSKGCWNLAVRCCGSACDLRWAGGAGSSAEKVEEEHGEREKNRVSTTSGKVSEGRNNPLLSLAPAFFKASRNWAELRSDGNIAEALLARQNCMVLSVSATLELYDSTAADDRHSASGSRENGSSGRREMLERARKEVEVATGLNRELSGMKTEAAAEMRSILLVAEMSVLGRLRDTVAVRSLVTSREPDFLRCSTNLLRYCVQLAEDMLDDSKCTSGLCRLCIRRCLEDDPVDTQALGGLYRRLLVSASSREEALRVVEDFTAKARDLQEGTPGIPADDMDYVAAKCYNLGLQLMEMGRPGEAERFVGKALGLVKLGSSRAFAARWEDTIFQVYRTALERKGGGGGGGGGGEGSAGSSSSSGGPTSTGYRRGGAFGGSRALFPTGLFPIPSGAAVSGQVL